MVPGGGRIGGHEELEGEIVTLLEEYRAQVQGSRDEHDAVEGNALVDQVPGQAGGARRPVALPGQEER